MLQTIRNLRTREILWAWPSSQDAGFECRCSGYKFHLRLHAQQAFKGALMRVVARKGIPVWLDLSLVLPKLTPSLHAFSMKLYFNVNRLVGYIVLEVVLKLS